MKNATFGLFFLKKLNFGPRKKSVNFFDEKNYVSTVRNEVKTAGYTLINVWTNYKYNQTQVNFGVSNVFDKHYDDPLGGSYLGQGATMTTGVSNGTAVPGMGRSFNFSLSLDF